MAELAELGGARARLEEMADSSGARVLKLSGELDLSNVGSIRAAIEITYGGPVERLVFDLSDLEFMDSSGLAMFLGFAESIEMVELCNLRPIVRRIIEIAGLKGVFLLTTSAERDPT
jgi:anti-anti-sigma factor